MMKNKGVIKVITIRDAEHEELIRLIEKFEGINVKKSKGGYKISIYESKTQKTPVGIVIEKSKKRKWKESLKPILSCEKSQECGDKNFVAWHSSSIIAKYMR